MNQGYKRVLIMKNQCQKFGETASETGQCHEIFNHFFAYKIQPGPTTRMQMKLFTLEK